jgi:hypothetical protein
MHEEIERLRLKEENESRQNHQNMKEKDDMIKDIAKETGEN